MDENTATQERFGGTVAVWYSAHHALTERDWSNIEEFKGPHHPQLGYYKNSDLPTLRQHLRWMRRAGIDTIVYDCYGFKQFECTDMDRDPTLPLLMEELAHQENEPRKLQLIIWLEKYIYNPTLEQYRTALGWVREHLAEQPYYYHWEGRPLVVTYHNGNNSAIDEIEWENDYFALKRIRPYHSDVWSYIEQYPQRLNRDWMVASPGFDPYLENAYLAVHVRGEENPDLEQIRQGARKHAADREGVGFFTKQLLRTREGNPRIIFISGWNDWQYANQIEPALEYGCQYVDLAARLLGRTEETASYREGADRA